MPLGKSLKKLQKRKADTKLHPRGRKLKQLTTAELRQAKLEQHKVRRGEEEEKKVERHLFIQAACDALGKDKYELREVRTLLQQFIDRDRREMEMLEEERRPGRPPSARYQQLQFAHERESREFTNGFLVLDITDEENVKRVKAWKGGWGGLNTLKMTRVKRE